MTRDNWQQIISSLSSRYYEYRPWNLSVRLLCTGRTTELWSRQRTHQPLDPGNRHDSLCTSRAHCHHDKDRYRVNGTVLCSIVTVLYCTALYWTVHQSESIFGHRLERHDPFLMRNVMTELRGISCHAVLRWPAHEELFWL